MRLLWIATKCPTPPIDGGRLVVLETIRALAKLSVEITLVAPVDPGEPIAEHEAALREICEPRLVPTASPSRARALAGSLVGGFPYAIRRHSLPAVRREVEALVAARRFDVTHVEQLHALSQATAAVMAGIPVLLRAQNVESDLWRAAARMTGSWARPWLLHEARRLERYETAALRRVDRVVTLSILDGERLRRLADGRTPVETVPPPFPSRLAAGGAPGRPLGGSPPLVVLGSSGWLPNRDSLAWCLDELWPRVRRENPGAALHLFADVPGDQLGPGVELHGAPADSTIAFDPGSVLWVPLRFGSGIRMKILEAWARGVPVLATPAAAAGLEATDGIELLIAADAATSAAAIAKLASDGALRATLIAGGRRLLMARYGPERVASELLAAYGATVSHRAFV